MRFRNPPPVRRLPLTATSDACRPGRAAPRRDASAPSDGASAPSFVSAPRRRVELVAARASTACRSRSCRSPTGPSSPSTAVSLPIRQGEVLALIGPSGCGKTTLLRSLNRLTELTKTASMKGRITLDGEDIATLEPTALRRRVTMVFQQPNPFPMSVFDNVAYVLREQASRRPRKRDLQGAVRRRARARGPLRRGRRRPRPPRPAALGRPAAAALHRPRARGRPRGAAARRALLGARPAVDAGDRGPDRAAARAGRGRDRHPQPAAGLPDRRLRRVHVPRRAGRVRAGRPGLRRAARERARRSTSVAAFG